MTGAQEKSKMGHVTLSEVVCHTRWTCYDNVYMKFEASLSIGYTKTVRS